MSIRQYVISDPANFTYNQSQYETTGIPSVVWQQQMDKAYIKTYHLVHHDKTDINYSVDYTENLDTQFRPLPLIEGNNPQYNDPDFCIDPYWDNSPYDQQTSQFKCEDYPPTDDEDYPEIPNNR